MPLLRDVGSTMEQSDHDKPMEEKGQEMLCPACLVANEPSVDFCVHCGRPLSSLATIDPVYRAYTWGWIYRKCASQPVSVFVLILLWLALGLPALGFLLYRLTLPGPERLVDYIDIAFAVLLCALYGMVLYKITRTFILKRRERSDEDDAT